ncbi:RrF2 family transcriptional regulator [Bacillus sp. 1NLA3E]|uniref:RrF2 family transcriptional regulator n=1 Tax=Bacillus sp. 1NLA3E TaxID=666686 RepID=UPI000247F46A|nr:Rrf2 family transcriptional regulator [Bacillus sp. 1NLA3E]AGK53782.1 nitric oxide sensitive transcriptional regulator [Bacillus sp. 1NLA3E]
MHLTTYTDYSLRVLIYLAAKKNNELSNIKEIAEIYDISKNHLMKIIYNMGKMGYIETIRGRNGGVRLAKLPSEINIGEIIRKTEEDFYIVECFEHHNNKCIMTPVCSLKHILNTALEQFLQVLDQYTLDDIVNHNPVMKGFFSSDGQSPLPKE